MPKAVVLTGYGPPDVLVCEDVALPEPGLGQVRIRVKAAGVSPTDAKIRGGYVQAVFPLPPEAVLGFEAAGVGGAIGPSGSVRNVGVNCASLLAGLGGYAEYVLASSWTPKPANVTWSDAAALPVAAEAAVGILKQLRVKRGETLLVLGAAGSVGMIATQLAASWGVTVIGAAAPRDQDLVRSLGAVPLARGPARVMTLADQQAPDLGVAFSVGTPDRAPEALDQTMPLLATGTLRIRRERQLPMEQAAEAHRLLENGDTHEKLILDTH